MDQESPVGSSARRSGRQRWSSSFLQSHWNRGVRWFAAEFLVVVSGVLMALALQAWYQARADARSERAYLEQLAADLDANIRIIANAVREDSIRLDANGRLLTALYRRGAIEPDSARVWLRWQLGFYSDPRPVLGTVNTLIETGDVRLVRDPELRSGIVAYASSMSLDMEELSRNVGRLTQANDAERRQQEQNDFAPLFPSSGTSRSLLPGSYGEEDVTRVLPQYLDTWAIRQADPDMRFAQAVRVVAFANRIFYLSRMLASTNDLRRKIGHVMND